MVSGTSVSPTELTSELETPLLSTTSSCRDKDDKSGDTLTGSVEMEAASMTISDNMCRPFGKRPPTTKEIIIRIVGSISFLLNVICIVVAKNPVGRIFVYISCGLGLILAPLSIYNQTRMTACKIYRDATEIIMGLIYRFNSENEFLQSQINTLERDVNRLNRIDEEFRSIMEKNGEDANSFLRYVHESKDILRKMRTVIKGRAMQSIIELVLVCDSKGDLKLRGRDLNNLLYGLSVMDELDISHDRLNSILKSKVEWNVSEVVQLMNNMLRDGRDEHIPFMPLIRSDGFINLFSPVARARVGVLFDADAYLSDSSLSVRDPKRYLKTRKR